MSKPNYSKPVDRLMVMPMPLARLLGMAHPGNPKEHAIDDLVASFNRFGFKDPPSIDEATMVMVTGHGRCIALEQMRMGNASAPVGIEVKDGEWMVPVLRGLTFKSELERDAYVIAANNLVLSGGWNFESLADMLRSIEDGGFEGLGFTESALDNILNADDEPDEPLDDRERTANSERSGSDAGPREVTGREGGERVGGREVGVVEHTRVIGGHRVRPAAQMTNDDWTVHLGDNVEGMRRLEDNSVDSIVTDPPSGIAFMCAKWDTDKGGRDKWIAWLAGVLREAMRVLKPGGHALVWALPRTSHWTTTAVEDSGMEIRDIHHDILPGDTVIQAFLESLTPAQRDGMERALASQTSPILYQAFGSGFPKSYNINKALLERIKERYDSGRCVCLDGQNGNVAGNDPRSGGRKNHRTHRERVAGSPGETRYSDVPIRPLEATASVQQLRQHNDAFDDGDEEIQAPVLQSRVLVGRAEETGRGHAEVRQGMEGDQEEDSQPRQGLSIVQENTGGERYGTGGSPPEAVQDRRDKSGEQPGGAVSVLPPLHRMDDLQGHRRDPNRNYPRGVHPDDQSGWTTAIARVCSWCGLPDQRWLNASVGVGTAAKPAIEHWILARKPLDGTVAENFMAHGTGGLRIDDCRIGTVDDCSRIPTLVSSDTPAGFGVGLKMGGGGHGSGRWPAHLSFEHSAGCVAVGERVESRSAWSNAEQQHRDGGESTNLAMGRQVAEGTTTTTTTKYECVEGCPVRMLDEQTGVSQSSSHIRHSSPVVDQNSKGDEKYKETKGHHDSGGASRFFTVFDGSHGLGSKFLYVAKPARSEKDAGLGNFPSKGGGEATGRKEGSKGTENPRAGAGRTGGVKNSHPTSKGISLMRWLVRMITPPGGTVLDCFAGSGTTGLAALVEGCKFIGFEKEPEYHAIACARMRSLIDENGVEVADAQEELDLEPGDEESQDGPEEDPREDWRRREMLDWVGADVAPVESGGTED